MDGLIIYTTIALLIIGNNVFSGEKLEKSFKIDYKNNQFLKDGKPFRYISGGLHYFRIPSIYWEDRLQKAQALGLNSIQTYVAWNVHEYIYGKYNFDEENDLLHFIELAAKYNLLVIIRPGPYIDAEWEFGGFPWWLAKDPTILMRTSKDERYKEYVQNWFSVLFTLLKPKLYKNGGPIIAFQVENEYGNYYACDKVYMRWLQSLFLTTLGDDVILFTTDGYTDEYLECGTIPSLYKTIDFGTELTARDAFKQQRKYEPHGPLVNSEYYTGWLDYWGEPHQTKDAKKIASYLDQILFLNASVNLYMFIGGTNFGFMNGVDIDKYGKFMVSPTSYDYDAPLSEAGDPRKKYYDLRKVLKKYVSKPLKPVPKATEKTAYGKIQMKMEWSLQSAILKLYPEGPFILADFPLSFEVINQSYGFLLYEIAVPYDFRTNNLNIFIEKIHDRSILFVDGWRQAIVSRGLVNVSISTGEYLQILVENQGRVAYAPKGSHYLPDAKGILGEVRINGKIIRNWVMYPLDGKKLGELVEIMDSSNELVNNRERNSMFFWTNFTVENITDTYLKMDGWTKGQIYINQFNVGRYWQSMGPQQTLFVPKNALKVGSNKLLVMELGVSPCEYSIVGECSVEFVDQPILG